MTFQEREQERKKFLDEFLSKVKELDAKRLEESEFKIGDKVEVTWRSRDFGKEKSKAVVSHVIIRGEGFHYYFNKMKLDGKESKHALYLPKYSQIINMKHL